MFEQYTVGMQDEVTKLMDVMVYRRRYSSQRAQQLVQAIEILGYLEQAAMYQDVCNHGTNVGREMLFNARNYLNKQLHDSLTGAGK